MHVTGRGQGVTDNNRLPDLLQKFVRYNMIMVHIKSSLICLLCQTKVDAEVTARNTLMQTHTQWRF